MTEKGKDSGGGHWVTINGNHVFIEDSAGKGKVLKGRVKKTEPVPTSDSGKDKKAPGGGKSPGGNPEDINTEKKPSIWQIVGQALFTAASVALAIQGASAASASQASGGYSGSENSSHEAPQYKTQIDNLVKQTKTTLAQESEKLKKMIEDVSSMPKGAERDSKWQDVLSRGAEIDKAKAVIDRIQTFNNHDMPEKIVDEIGKLSYSLPQGFVESLQPLGGDSGQVI